LSEALGTWSSLAFNTITAVSLTTFNLLSLMWLIYFHKFHSIQSKLRPLLNVDGAGKCTFLQIRRNLERVVNGFDTVGENLSVACMGRTTANRTTALAIV
jgi:hypothetical protein